MGRYNINFGTTGGGSTNESWDFGSGTGDSGGSNNNVTSTEDKIVDSNLDDCSKGILSTLKNLGKNDIAQVLNRFGGTSATFNWEIQTGTPSNSNNLAETNWEIDNSGNAVMNSYVTTLRTSYTNSATNLAIARTILHEAIHAYILSYVDELISDRSTANNFKTDFPNIWNFFVASRNGVEVGNIEDAHHQEMAENYVNVISDALASFDNNQQDGAYYDYLAWGALMNTDAFNSSLGPNGNMDQSEQEAIHIADEDTNSANAKGTPCP